MMAGRRSRLAVAAGFLGALVVLGVLVTLVGAERVGASVAFTIGGQRLSDIV